MSYFRRSHCAHCVGLSLLGATFFLLTCTDAGLQPIPKEVEYFDDQLEITGQFCTSPADEVAFPVKLLIVLDQSASLQCTDATNARYDALDRAGSQLDALPNVEFGVIGFASWSNLLDFTGDWSQASAMLTADSGGPATDYQGALSTVVRVLEQDMIRSGPAETARSKYIVLFMSDGIPEPRCTQGCDDGEDMSLPDPRYAVCNTTEDIEEGDYVDMYGECPDYNQPEQIKQKVENIMELADIHGVGSLEINTVFLFAPQADVEAVCGNVDEDFGYNREEAEPLLRGIAEKGLGTFRDVNTSEEIDFLELNYESLMTPYQMKEFFALNINTLPGETGVLGDSDRDGIDDDREDEEGLKWRTADSDEDNYSDLFELRFMNNGFDPKKKDVPADPASDSPLSCRDNGALDSDGDGLKNCEEKFLETDPLLVDTDGDRMPDGIEFRFGTDPLHKDTLVDHDFDGRFSGPEIRTGLSPILLEEENALTNQIRYSVQQGPTDEDETRCYDFDIQGITLFPTRYNMDEDRPSGTNRILIFADEEPANTAGDRGRYHVACVEAQYLGKEFKSPADGLIDDLIPERFVPMQIFDPELHCLKTGDNPGLLLDGGMP